MIRLLREFRLLGAAGATRNAKLAIEQRQEVDWTLEVLAARLRHPSMTDQPRRQTAA